MEDGGNTRRKAIQSQIDYLMTTAREGQAEVSRDMNHPLIVGCGHRPVKGEMVYKKEEWTRSNWKHIRRDWRPVSEKDM